MDIPESHPRRKSLLEREKLIEGYEKGLVVDAGLIAHGRGEAFDYLFGEKTTRSAVKAEKAAVASLLLAERPVISVNGNAGALCAKELVELAKVAGAELEVNLFYRSEKRIRLLVEWLKKNGAKRVYGIGGERARIPELESERRRVSRKGIYSADVVLVPLEDGDRTEALVKMGKRVVAIDLNPLSRTAQKATITIVDDIVRAVPKMIEFAGKMKGKHRKELEEVVRKFDNRRNLREALEEIKEYLEKQG